MKTRFITCYLLPLILIPIHAQDIKFERISVEQGLSQSNINCIFQDSQGFMWFGSALGLKKFDGYKFINYKHDPNEPESLSGNNVGSIIEDRSGSLWITTSDGGLDRFDRELEKFIHYKISDSDSLQKKPIKILTAIGDQYGNLWIGTRDSGLFYFNQQNDTFENYPQYLSINSRQGRNYISVLYEDREGIIWIGSGNGLFRFDPVNELYTHYYWTPEDSRLSDPRILSIAEDKSGTIFVGTYLGLNKFDKQKNRFTYYFSKTPGSQRGPKNVFRDLCPAKSGLVWIATADGLVIFNPKNEEFVIINQNLKIHDNLDNNSIFSIYEDRWGIIWFGTVSGDIFKYDPNKIKFIHYKHSPKDPYSISHGHILDIWQDSEATLWVGTWGGGLNELRANQLNTHSPKWIVHKHDPLNSKSIQSNSVFHIYEDSKKTLWFSGYDGTSRLVRPATYSTNKNNPKYKSSFIRELKITGIMYEDKQNNFWIGTTRGLYKFDRSTKSFTHYAGDPDNPESLGENNINCIFQSRSGQMWIGAKRWGLYKYYPENEKFIRYFHNPENPKSLSSNEIFRIYEDESGFLWMTTLRGLNKLDPETGKITHYNSNVGLPDDATYSIFDDNEGNLWISGNKGIFRFSPKSNSVKSFDTEDGLQSTDFNPWGHKSKSGWMYFSGINGFNAFHPDSIKYNEHIPEIILSDFQIFNNSIRPGNDSPLKRTIAQAREIILSHGQSVFSFEFTVLDYHNPQKNKYAYKMDGVDPEWVYTDASRRFATYTHLKAGEYVFRVKGSNNDGVWNEEGVSINVIILPPWWETNWAYSFYVFLVLALAGSIWRFQSNRLKMKQQLQMEQFETEKLREVDNLKSHFFANISHEFRTPLTLIKGPVKQIMDGEFSGNLMEQCKMIFRNSDRLLGLINQILDLSKLESGGMKLQVSETPIINYLKGIVLSFASLAEQKKINLQFKETAKSIIGFIDRDKLEKIVTNLLSNAFKFTPEEGDIEVHISRGEAFSAKILNDTNSIAQNVSPQQSQFPIPNSQSVQITISNTGPGIPADRIEKIFDRFYQAGDNYKKDSEGTGIGLALTKELVQAHHGKITVTSMPNKSTTFKIILPVDKTLYKEDEIIDLSTVRAKYPETTIALNESDQAKDASPRPVSSIEHPVSRILIVEDNPDVISYISSFLENEYRILTAENGKEGFKKALDKYPDLIISDVMMPEMDGFEMCRKIKTDERISHIPVILLTAKADLDSKIDGLEYGADDYVTKPFEARELQIRSKNLIEQRRKLREKFSQLNYLNPEDISVTSADEKLLQRLLDVFEEHIEDVDFSTEGFAREVGMSRMNLNRKLQALANQSTNEFIKTLRLKRAAQLLKETAGNVSEIAYKVGFNNTSHFAKAFRKLYGLPPSRFNNKEK